MLPSGYQAQIVGGLTAYIGTLGHVIAAELGNRTAACELDTSILRGESVFHRRRCGECVQHRSGGAAYGRQSLPPDVSVGNLSVSRRLDRRYRVDAQPMGRVLRVARPQRTRRRACVPDDARAARRRRHPGTDLQAAKSRSGQQRSCSIAARACAFRSRWCRRWKQLFDVDQYVARDAFGTISHPTQGDLTAPMTPFKLYERRRLRAAPRRGFGAHTRARSGRYRHRRDRVRTAAARQCGGRSSDSEAVARRSRHRSVDGLGGSACGAPSRRHGRRSHQGRIVRTVRLVARLGSNGRVDRTRTRPNSRRRSTPSIATSST